MLNWFKKKILPNKERMVIDQAAKRLSKSIMNDLYRSRAFDELIHNEIKRLQEKGILGCYPRPTNEKWYCKSSSEQFILMILEQIEKGNIDSTKFK